MSSVIRGSDNFDSSPMKSMVRVGTSNGYGSTNTMIRRFLTVISTVGSDITYADSATLGASFTVNAAGMYSVTLQEAMQGLHGLLGISVDTTQPTTSIHLINAVHRLALSQTYAATAFATCSNTVYLPAGSVVRAHTDGGALSTNPCQFTITRVA